MKRKWNWSLWVGLVVAVAGMFSYEFFAQFPATRDFPWANLLLFAIGGILLVLGLVRAFGNPRVYRGKIVGPIFTVFYVVRQMPASTGAPRSGKKHLISPCLTKMENR
ncbi:MAG TPA: hypothetical protein VGW99_03155 [Chthoniobacterales bacterium]|nr:hypothetical protein [Chthoniobacterales bacterium]